MHSLQGNRTQLRPGFPIRTPSDQRFVDNSPRLNAVSHVLHRLSMPRHPPCALEQQTHTRKTQHTKQNTHKQKTRCSRPLYSSHTPHPPPTNQHKNAGKQMTGHKGSTTPTPNSAGTMCRPRHPTVHQQSQINVQPASETINHTHLAPNATAMHVHLVFTKNNVGSTTVGHSTNTPTTAGKNKSSLERR